MSDWSNLAHEARAHSPGPTCQVQSLLMSLPGEDAEQVEKVLGDKGFSNPGIHRALYTRLGDGTPTKWSIGNHRRGNCACNPGRGYSS